MCSFTSAEDGERKIFVEEGTRSGKEGRSRKVSDCNMQSSWSPQLEKCGESRLDFDGK